jgi:hypothetical protein
MPLINIYKCSKCQKVLHEGWGGYQYVENEDGERVCCPHPIEDYTICDVLHITPDEFLAISPPSYMTQTELVVRKLVTWWWSWARMARMKKLVETRTGFNSNCICKVCLRDSCLDIGDAESSDKSWRWYYKATLRKDERKCPHCRSHEIATVMELVGSDCPFCKQGCIVEISTGAIS